MSSQEEFDRHRNYYLIKLRDSGVINRVQLRKGNRYFAERFEATIRIFI